MISRRTKLLAPLLAFSVVVAACGGDDDDTTPADTPDEGTAEAPDEGTADEGTADEGTAEAPAEGTADMAGAEVTITGSERDDPSVAAINKVLGDFAEANGFTVTFTGDADWEANINTQVSGGNPPDISFFPQPGKLADFAEDGFLVPVTEEVSATVDEFWADSYQQYGVVDGVQYGVPAKTDLKSLVWYKPARFEEAGYAVPETIDEFRDLMAQMVADGNGAPLCVGIESGQATGWTYTDWVEEMVLRLHGGDVYDQWVNHEIPFDDPRIVEAMDAVLEFWAPENVFASGGSIAATNFGDNAQPLVDDQCWMHRQASFFAGFFPDGTPFADPSNPDAIDVFYFPDINGDRPALTAGTLAGAFNDDPATMAIMEYLATAEYAELRQAEQTAQLDGGLSGYLSAAQGQDPSVYQPLEQSFLEILNNAEISRFDASDLMPAQVGAGSFWSEGVSAVTGTNTAEEAAAAIEDSWPEE